MVSPCIYINSNYVGRWKMDTYFIILLATLIFYVLIFVILRKNGGFKNNMGAYLVFGIYFLYFVLNPFYAVMMGKTKLFGYDSFDSLDYLSLVYFLASIFTFLGFLLGGVFRKPEISYNESLAFDCKFARFWLLFGIISIVLWAILTGYGIKTLFLANLFVDTGSDFAKTGDMNYLKQLFLFSVVGLIFAKNSTMTTLEYLSWFFVIVLITIGFGFRYIVIILFLSLFFYSSVDAWQKRKLSLLSIKNITLAIFLMIFIIGLGQFRNYIKSEARGIHNVSAVEFSQEYDLYSSIFTYSRNFIADSALIQSVQNGKADIDYGHTLVLQNFIRAVPSSVIGDKPYPKSLIASKESWNNVEGYMAGEAFTHIGEFYFTGGLFGVILLSTVFGFIVHVSTSNLTTKRKVAFATITLGSLFHYITRGYFAGFLMAYFFYIVPTFFIRHTSDAK